MAKVEYIPAVKDREIIPAAIYVRVSSNSAEQLKSLSAQVSALTNYISNHSDWKQVDSYVEVASAKTVGDRAEFNRLLKDCKLGKVKLVVIKSISRFGRDTLEVLDSLRQLKDTGTRFIFVQEGLDSATTKDELMLSVIESVAQFENESRSANIRMGMEARAKQGTLGLYKKPCYGYCKDENGDLAINEEEAEVVRLIFSLYLHGYSLTGIKKELESRGIPSPQGKENWSKSRISDILRQEKYIGNVHVLKNDNGRDSFLAEGAHPAILEKGVFYAVQDTLAKRSNMEKTADGMKRKSTKYSSKKALK